MIKRIGSEVVSKFLLPLIDHGADSPEELQEKLSGMVELIRSEGDGFMVRQVGKQLELNVKWPRDGQIALNGHLHLDGSERSGVEPVVACGADLYELPDDEQVLGPEVTCPDCWELIRRAEHLVEA
jgi:hypothetical protein